MAVTIPLTYVDLTQHYPYRPREPRGKQSKLLHPQLGPMMDRTPGTPCCVQVSHCFNMAGHAVPPTYPGYRREASPVKINGTVHRYILAVDELAAWLTSAYGEGEVLRGATGRSTPPNKIRAAIEGRPGLIASWGGKGKFWHTEFWNGARWLQPDIVDGFLDNPRVVFWDVTPSPPEWLIKYMASQ